MKLQIKQNWPISSILLCLLFQSRTARVLNIFCYHEMLPDWAVLIIFKFDKRFLQAGKEAAAEEAVKAVEDVARRAAVKVSFL